jgi:hypothetical protein
MTWRVLDEVEPTLRSGLLWRFLLTSAAVGLLAILSFALWRKPILLHVLADTGCACGEYHTAVTGLVLRNPFRDRSPEDTASRFLEDLRNGRCTVNDAVCGYALKRHRISDWQLRNRVDRGNHVELYYKLTKYGVREPEYNLTGEGLIEVAKASTAWSIVGYSAYF